MYYVILLRNRKRDRQTWLDENTAESFCVELTFPFYIPTLQPMSGCSEQENPKLFSDDFFTLKKKTAECMHANYLT